MGLGDPHYGDHPHDREDLAGSPIPSHRRDDDDDDASTIGSRRERASDARGARENTFDHATDARPRDDVDAPTTTTRMTGRARRSRDARLTTDGTTTQRTYATAKGAAATADVKVRNTSRAIATRRDAVTVRGAIEGDEG